MKSKNPQNKQQRVLFLTAMDVESQAVREHLRDILPDEETNTGSVYEQGLYDAPSETFRVHLVETGKGMERAAFETERAIHYVKPTYVFFVGVAGGLKDVSLLDVVAATKVYGFEYGKAASVFQPRPDFGESSFRLLQKARYVRQQNEWIRKIKNPTYREVSAPKAFLAPIAAGAKVVASQRSQTYRFLMQNFTDALAVETEAIGYFRAVHANDKVKALLVRGISDLIVKKAQTEMTGSQLTASRHAAAFAFAVLSALNNTRSPSSKSRLKISKRDTTAAPATHFNQITA